MSVIGSLVSLWPQGRRIETDDFLIAKMHVLVRFSFTKVWETCRVKGECQYVTKQPTLVGISLECRSIKGVARQKGWASFYTWECGRPGHFFRVERARWHADDIIHTQHKATFTIPVRQKVDIRSPPYILARTENYQKLGSERSNLQPHAQKTSTSRPTQQRSDNISDSRRQEKCIIHCWETKQSSSFFWYSPRWQTFTPFFSWTRYRSIDPGRGRRLWL